MKKLFTFLLCVSPALTAWGSPAWPGQAAAVEAALQKNAAPVASFYINEYQNPTEELLYQQAFKFLDTFPPKGKKSVFKLTRQDMPKAEIYVYVASVAKLRDYLIKAGKNPDTFLPKGTNGVTIPMVERATGDKKLLIFIASDLVMGTEKISFPMSQNQQYKFVAKLSALLAHEIYGHAYMYAYDARRDIPQKEQEIYAYKQSADFMERISLHPEVKKWPGLLNAVNSVLEEETYRQFVWERKK